jgi:hypothetical protein
MQAFKRKHWHMQGDVADDVQNVIIARAIRRKFRE